MESNLQQIISDALRNASGGGAKSPDFSALAGNLIPISSGNFSETFTNLAKQLDALRTVSQVQAEVTGTNTEAISQNTIAQSSGGIKDTASTIGKAASSFLGSGLGLIPAVSALTKLFGGGRSEAPPSLIKFSAPPSIRFDADYATLSPRGSSTSNSIRSIDYGQNRDGQAVLQQAQAPSDAQPKTSNLGTREPSQINIQVNAIDSRSFMDHSQEIATAVREAMLNMHSLNDLVNDL